MLTHPLSALIILLILGPILAAGPAAGQDFLSPEERAFVRAHPPLRVHNELDWPPYNFNEGSPTGYSIDFFNLVAERAGFQVEYISSPSWREFMQMIETRQLDVMLNIADTEDRRRFLRFTRPYLIVSAGIYVRNGHGQLNSLAALKGHTVAVPEGFFFEERLRKYSPEIRLLLKRNALESLQAVATGAADATIGTVDVQDYLIRQQGLDNLLLANHLDDNRFTAVMHLAVHRDAPMLHRILQKSMDALDETAVARINQRWTRHRQTQNLRLSSEERRFLDGNPAIRAMIGPPQPPFFFLDEDQITGYAVDLSHRLAAKMGVGILFSEAPPGLSLEAIFAQRLADIVITTPRAAQQAGHSLLSKPLFGTYLGISTRRDGVGDSPLEHLAGQRIAVLEQQGIGAALAENYLLLPVESDLQALEAVSQGDAVAAIGPHPVQHYLLREHFMTDLDSRPLGNAIDLPRHRQSLAVRPDWPILAGILDKAIDALTREELNTLQNRWQMHPPADRPRFSLSDPERRELAQHPSLSVCRNPEWAPALSGAENQGMTQDFIDLLSRQLGIPMTLLNHSSWPEAVQALKAGECQLLAQAVATDTQDFLFTRPYLSFRAVIATRKEELFVRSLSQVLDRRIAVVTGPGLQEQLATRYPDLDLVPVVSVEQGLDKVRRGEVYGLVDAIPSIGASLHRLGYDDVKIAGRLEEYWHLSFALRPGAEVLRAVMDKAIEGISPEQQQLIYDRWTSIRYIRETDYRHLWQLAAGFSLLVGFLLYRHRNLRQHNQQLHQAGEELRTAHAALTQVNAALLEKSHKLEELSVTDQLTGVYNRLRLHQVIDAEIARASRYQTDFAVIMLDVDNFKQVNDSHGHQMGDTVLRQVAMALHTQARRSDTVGRWGGEEFLILCPETDQQGALQLAQLMRQRLHELNIDAMPRLITASFGVAAYQQGESRDDLIARADHAMYRAKAQGKDQVQGQEAVSRLHS